MAQLIELKDIKKTYLMGENVVRALDGVSLKIDKEEFLAIIGPSGSGKSTLMHILGLLDTATNGKVFLNGKEVSFLTEEERSTLRGKHIGFIFQSFNLLARTTALDNVEMPLIYSGVSREERIERAKEALEAVGLSDRLSHLPSQLSGGQQQRVAIARALVSNPDLILADEPTGNVDSKSGKEILELLSRLNKKGHTIILVTHNKEIASHAKRKIELMDGKVVKDI